MANTQGRFRANSGLLKWQTLNKQNYLFFDNRSQNGSGGIRINIWGNLSFYSVINISYFISYIC